VDEVLLQVLGIDLLMSVEQLQAEHTAQLTTDRHSWYLAYTKPKQESVARFNLSNQGFDAYLPLYKAWKKSLDNGTMGFEPMFPRYVFFRPSSPRQSLSAVRSTRGVQSIVRFGFEPATLKQELLDAIRIFEDQRNHSGLDEVSPFQPGSRVRLRDPALRELEGVVHMVSSKRVAVLIEILGRQKVVSVEHRQLEMA
jgi:transcriptional antiterminator RfaH